MSVRDWLHEQARALPAHPAVIAPGGDVISYAALDRRVAALCERLHAAGVVPGARLLALVPTGTALVELVQFVH